MTETLSMDEIRDRIVLAALAHVPFDGWCPAALQAGARDAGFDASMAERAFLAGPAAAVEHFAALADRRLEAAAADDATLAGLGLTARIGRLVRLRLLPWAEHREAVRRALSLLTLPSHAARAAEIGWRTADSLWFAAGDRSADFSYYTKRLSLAAVYSSTLLFWLEDSSDGFADSWAFLDRRLTDFARLPRLQKQIGAQLQALPNPLTALRQTVLGLGGRKNGPRRRFGVRAGSR
ncbi:hypothetical protein GALL_80060 [mine drainage metagenome]|uniref:COQ9 C-terminal domain-containing protein n=1 Tax=mine drainage metagenome TaxID=410659 RepID=A0A1J5TD89_9ZZZZ